MKAAAHLAVVTDPLADLRTRRAAIYDRLESLTGKLAKLNTAENSEREALEAIAELGRVEIAEMQRWLSVASAEPAPKPNMERRAELNHQLAEAMQLTETLRRAAAGVQDEMALARGELAEVAALIEAEALTLMERECLAEIAALRDVSVAIQSRLADVAAFRTWLGERGRALVDKGQAEQARPLFAMMERFGHAPAIEFAPTIGAVDAAKAAWAGKFAGMIA